MLSAFKNFYNNYIKYKEEKEPTWEELHKKYPFMDINPDYTLPCSGTGPVKTEPYKKFCHHPAHNFPSHLYIPPGQSFTHICPGCGEKTTVTNNVSYTL